MAQMGRYRPIMVYRLGVDLGTTFTAAAVDDGSGPSMLGLGNRALTVPSVVFLASDGTFHFGEAADRRAASEPTRAAREFKRRIGDTVPILLAGQPYSPQALSAKLLSWVVSVAAERQGGPPEEVVVTYPANWGGYKRELLDQLVSLADVPRALTCTEPEAAATQYASRARLAAGDRVAVYDLGGGTFDVCVLEKQDPGFRIVGSPDGVEHLGGIDFDEAVFQHVLGLLPGQVADLDPDDPDVTQGVARLRRECVEAKEALSSDIETTIPVDAARAEHVPADDPPRARGTAHRSAARHARRHPPGPSLGGPRALGPHDGGAGRGQLPDPVGEPPAADRVRGPDRHGHPPQARHRPRGSPLPALPLWGERTRRSTHRCRMAHPRRLGATARDAGCPGTTGDHRRTDHRGAGHGDAPRPSGVGAFGSAVVGPRG